MNLLNSSKLVSRSLIGAVGLSASAITLLVTGNPAQAQVNIEPGYDLFTTSTQFESFYSKEVDVPNVGLVPVTIPLMAHPFIPGTNIDTKVRRLDGCPNLVFGQPCTERIQMAGLSLKSSEPVDIAGQLFDVKIVSGDLFDKPENPIVDAIITLNEEETGGEITVPVLPFDVMVTFSPVDGGDPIMQQDSIVFPEWTTLWSTTAGMMDAHNDNMPAGGLYVGIIPGTDEKAPPQPHLTPDEAHYIEAAMTTPEPSAIVPLALFGLAGIWGVKKKQSLK